jgi:hypothetical protein
MDAIAAKAGVSKRTVYSHFPGKDVLFAAVIAARLGESGSTPHPSPSIGESISGPSSSSFPAIKSRGASVARS